LSSYATGDSPNNKGVCSPAHAVRWEEHNGFMDARLNGILIDRYGPGEPAAYPTLCKGRFAVEHEVDHAIEAPTSLNAIGQLPRLLGMGVAALKIEGRQRSPRYVEEVVRTLRAAIDSAKADPQRYAPRQEWQAALSRHAEGMQVTQGALERAWK
jgi:putative protease